MAWNHVQNRIRKKYKGKHRHIKMKRGGKRICTDISAHHPNRHGNQKKGKGSRSNKAVSVPKIRINGQEVDMGEV